MRVFNSIIVPVDFHQHTDDIADFAMDVAAKMGAKVTFLHVLEKVIYYSDYTPSLEQLDDEIVAHAEKKMHFLVKRYMSSGCEGLVLKGDVADSIVEYVKEKEPDLLIMGTHGAKGIEKVMLGSVADRVIKRATCPVLTFNPYRGEHGYTITSSIGELVTPA